MPWLYLKYDLTNATFQERVFSMRQLHWCNRLCRELPPIMKEKRPLGVLRDKSKASQPLRVGAVQPAISGPLAVAMAVRPENKGPGLPLGATENATAGTRRPHGSPAGFPESIHGFPSSGIPASARLTFWAGWFFVVGRPSCALWDV